MCVSEPETRTELMANPGKPRRVNISSLTQSSQHQWLSEVLARQYGEEYVTRTQLPLSTYWRFNAQRQDQDVEILYHTKLMGRLNLCDGRDSLYSLYLKEMFRIVGEGNVIVVVDDVTGETDRIKQRLRREQPTLQKCQELFVFTTSDCKADIIAEFFGKFVVTEKKKRDQFNVWRLGVVVLLLLNTNRPAGIAIVILVLLYLFYIVTISSPDF
eukprot:gi/632972165/ref/XP_007902526.1/ PREDICTED: uncharacterized protein LOC103185697 [Callorhinchus milii]